jgi:hypothetical protein
MTRTFLILSIVLALCAAARAQTKISALPSGTPTTTDIVPYVADPSGTAATKKTTVADLFGALTPFSLQSANKHGDGTKFQLFTGSSSTNDCAKFDSNGNVVTNGGTCAAAAPVQSVFGRTGSVISAANDYNFNQLAGTASNSQLPSTISSKTLDNTNTASFKGSLFTLQDATDTTKQARFDLSNVGAGQTRIVNVPNANSTTAQAKSATSHQFFTAMDAQGVFTAAQPSAGDVTGTVAIAQGGTGATDAATARANIGAGTGNGSVTSVAVTVPGVIFSISGSPITTSGTLAFSLLTQTANTVFAGPTSGGAATPTFRAQVAADIPSLDASKITTGSLADARISSASTWNAKAALAAGSYTTSISAGSTGYVTGGASSSAGTEAQRQLMTAYAGTAKGLCVHAGSAQPATGSLVFTLRVNGVDTALVATIAASGTSNCDTTHTVSYAANDLLSVSIVNNASAGSAANGVVAFWMQQ